MIASDYHGKTKADLEKLHTRQLMALKKRAFVPRTRGCALHCGDEALSEEDQNYNKVQSALRALINEILPTREHVPSKAEGKALRQAAAKKGR